jgi:hypothetical protein
MCEKKYQASSQEFVSRKSTAYPSGLEASSSDRSTKEHKEKQKETPQTNPKVDHA